MPHTDPIQFLPHTLETHFLFFYDLKARIVPWPAPPKRLDAHTFEWRTVKTSELNQFFFSDSFLTDLLAAHFHGTHDTLAKRHPTITFSTHVDDNVLHHEFDFPLNPVGVSSGTIPSYAPIECTLFKHGILTVLLRVTNRTAISDTCYVDSIRRPEYIGAKGEALTRKYRPGPLIRAIWPLLDEVEFHLKHYLQSLDIQAVTIEDGNPKPIRFLGKPSSTHDIAPGETTDTPECIYHELKRSRPYVGTVVDLSSSSGSVMSPSTRELCLAVASARTTPEFLEHFNKVDDYVMEGEPRRNIYYPGPSIVFIGRRGWTCVKRDQRDAVAFQMGVVEVVLFVIEAVLSSVRATRRFVRDVIEHGESTGRRLHLTLLRNLDDRSARGRSIETSTANIYEFNAFLARVRLTAPFDDMSVLLSPHLTTHTGIAAVQRMRHLTDHRELVENARTTVANYTSFLEGATQYWLARAHVAQQESARSNAKVLRFTAVSLVVLVVSVVIDLLLRLTYGW